MMSKRIPKKAAGPGALVKHVNESSECVAVSRRFGLLAGFTGGRSAAGCPMRMR
jgi:hypothetical protein